eukprot:TRINITY_DN3523_c0_g4_i1.p1 TRINITY_DN3523_c0_g4~~TRINITY_DN3523_c0_g4_i1.p1  ORF type:complete len:231 (+),score=68.58 TRINITY_DN3523_c0_g4_i1:49-741(+)
MSFDDISGGSAYVRMGNERRGPSAGPTGSNSQGNAAVEQIVAKIQLISGNNSSISRLSSYLGTPKDDQDLRDKISVQTDKTKKLIMETGESIKRLSNIKASPAEAQQIKVQQQKLTKDFKVVAEKFQEIAQASARKERMTKPNSQSTEGGRPSAPYLSESDEERQSLLHQQEAKRKQVMAFESEVTVNEALIREREESIRELERAVLDVNEIYKDLAILVQEQGETLGKF